MRQIEDWIHAIGGAPAIVVIGLGYLAVWVPLGICLIVVGTIWFVLWLDPVRRLLMRFLSYPDRRFGSGTELVVVSTEPEAVSDEGSSPGDGTHIHAEAGSMVIVHNHPPEPEGKR